MTNSDEFQMRLQFFVDSMIDSGEVYQPEIDLVVDMCRRFGRFEQQVSPERLLDLIGVAAEALHDSNCSGCEVRSHSMPEAN